MISKRVKRVCPYCGGPLRASFGSWRCQQATDAFNADLLHLRQNLLAKYGDHILLMDDPLEEVAS